MNASDYILTLLVNTGKKQWLRSDIIDMLSESLKIEKVDANSRFANTISRTEYFEKISDNPIKYQLSKIGEVRYKTIKNQETRTEQFSEDVEEFLKKYYWDEFLKCIKEGKELLEIDFHKLRVGMPNVAEKLFEKPQETIKSINNAIKNIEVGADVDVPPQISIYNLGESLQVENIKTNCIGKFVEVEGRVVIQSMPRSEMTLGAFKCMRCDHVMYLPQESYKNFVEPYLCESDYCGKKGPFKRLEPPDSVYVDGQEIVIESLRGEVTIKAHLTGSLCCHPRERDAKVVRITGIVNSSGTISKQGVKTNCYEWVIEVNNIKLAEENNTEPPTEKEIQMFEEWGKDPHELRKKIIGSIAPYIHGHIAIKDACSLTWFSDWTWEDNPDDVIERSSIHIFLFGDPGVAKSQIIKDVVYLAPKGKFGVVTNMTKGGLSTVAVPENGEWHVKSGFFSLGDQGLIGLDEIDKVKDPADLNCLVTVLNDQIQKVSKIGKNDIPFMTRTAVLGAANPKGGHLTRDTIMSQLASTIPSYIFQRFDLKFVIRDIPDKEMDDIIADNVNSMHRDPKASRKKIQRDISPDLIRKYILYARTKPVPDYAPNAQKLIKEYYRKIRQQTKEDEYPAIGARQLNDVNRISRAIARREMAPIITEEHVKYAIGIMKASIVTWGEDDDYSIYNVGKTRITLERIQKIRNAIIEICKKDKSAKIEDIAFISGEELMVVEHTIIMMEKNREVMRYKEGYRVV